MTATAAPRSAASQPQAPPGNKWLGNFDFDAIPNVNAATIHTLATGDWIRRGDPLSLIGDSGTGKNHLLIGLGTSHAADRYTTWYQAAVSPRHPQR
ncbi:ATP-binding protein [Agromyces laixinhei]|uniref:ATP-binding protein n=1 Tax=Agromyces laixinhei TaxID=2585717 RepID=UPI0030841459